MSALCTDDCIVHVGRDEMKLEDYLNMLKSYSTSFFQHNTIIDDYFAEDNKVVLRWTSSLKHTGKYKGVDPTREEIVISGIPIHQYVEGKINEIWISWDRLGLVQKIG